jgi:hypothetical protein
LLAEEILVRREEKMKEEKRNERHGREKRESRVKTKGMKRNGQWTDLKDSATECGRRTLILNTVKKLRSQLLVIWMPGTWTPSNSHTNPPLLAGY